MNEYGDGTALVVITALGYLGCAAVCWREFAVASVDWMRGQQAVRTAPDRSMLWLGVVGGGMLALVFPLTFAVIGGKKIVTAVRARQRKPGAVLRYFYSADGWVDR